MTSFGRGAALVAMLGWFPAVGCGSSDPHQTEWFLRFVDPPTEMLATYVEGRILQAGCGTGRPLYSEDASREVVPGVLAAGRYGFEGIARDSACNRIGYGCSERDLPMPAGESIETLLTTLAPISECARAQCTNGRCDPLLDGGMDVGLDTGPEAGDSSEEPPLDDRPNEVPPDVAPADVAPDMTSELGPDVAPDLPPDGTPMTCPIGCSSSVGPNGHTYCLCLADALWTAASTTCAAAGARLVRVDNATENSWLRSLANLGGVTGNFWIGASDQGLEGDWQWEDGQVFWRGPRTGSPVDGLYSNWNAGQPTAVEPLEDFGRMLASDTWTDTTSPADLHPFVCEFY